MSNKLELYQQLINLTNTFTTVICDMYAADVDGVTLNMTNNVTPSIILDNEVLMVRMDCAELTTDFTDNTSKIFDNEMSLEDYLESVRGCFDEDDWHNNAHEVGTITQQVKSILATYQSITDPVEVERQLIYAHLTSKWNSVLRWLEEIEQIGVDELVTYEPLVQLISNTPDDSLRIYNKTLSLILRPDGTVRVAASPMAAIDYFEYLLREEGQAVAEHYIKESIQEIVAINQSKWNVFDHK